MKKLIAIIGFVVSSGVIVGMDAGPGGWSMPRQLELDLRGCGLDPCDIAALSNQSVDACSRMLNRFITIGWRSDMLETYLKSGNFCSFLQEKGQMYFERALSQKTVVSVMFAGIIAEHMGQYNLPIDVTKVQKDKGDILRPEFDDLSMKTRKDFFQKLLTNPHLAPDCIDPRNGQWLCLLAVLNGEYLGTGYFHDVFETYRKHFNFELLEGVRHLENYFLGWRLSLRDKILCDVTSPSLRQAALRSKIMASSSLSDDEFLDLLDSEGPGLIYKDMWDSFLRMIISRKNFCHIIEKVIATGDLEIAACQDGCNIILRDVVRLCAAGGIDDALGKIGFLIDRGAKVGMKNLLNAYEGKDLYIAKLLTEKSNPTEWLMPDGYASLLIKLLENVGATSSGLVKWSASSDDVESLVRFIVDKNPNVLMVYDCPDTTPLWCALRLTDGNLRLRLVELFLDKKPETAVAFDRSLNTLLADAASRGLVREVELLCAKHSFIQINVTNYSGDTALHCAVKNENSAAIDDYAAVVVALLQAGASADIKNNEGKTPRDVAKNEAIKKILLTPGKGKSVVSNKRKRSLSC